MLHCTRHDKIYNFHLNDSQSFEKSKKNALVFYHKINVLLLYNKKVNFCYDKIYENFNVISVSGERRRMQIGLNPIATFVRLLHSIITENK